MRVVALIHNPLVVQRILEHLRLWDPEPVEHRLSGVAAAARAGAAWNQGPRWFSLCISSVSPCVGRPQTAIGVDASDGPADDGYNTAETTTILRCSTMGLPIPKIDAGKCYRWLLLVYTKYSTP